jgi:hypothetical protein
MERISGSLIALGRFWRGLLQSQAPAGSSNGFLPGAGFQELKAVAEGASLAHHGGNLHTAERQIEFQPDHFSDRDFRLQNGGNARFADIDRSPPNHRAITRKDPNLHLELKAGMTPRIGLSLHFVDSELPLQFQRGDRPSSVGRGSSRAILTPAAGTRRFARNLSLSSIGGQPLEL